MLTFNQIYHPLTSRPFLANQSYMEYQPCRQLLPYVACYWVSDPQKSLNNGRKVYVVPDSCIDIIVRFNYTRQKMSGYLCGMHDQTFVTEERWQEGAAPSFAVRFHFWGAHLFLPLNYHEIHNKNIPLEVLGREWSHLFERFLEEISLTGRIRLMEDFLLKKLGQVRINDNLFNSVEYMLKHPGRSTVKEICAASCISQRQMERLYQQQVGLSIKRISSIVRYQNVWHDMNYLRQFDIHDAVHRYGYTDQAHLLKEFKRFHGLTPTEAQVVARNNR